MLPEEKLEKVRAYLATVPPGSDVYIGCDLLERKTLRIFGGQLIQPLS